MGKKAKSDIKETKKNSNLYAVQKIVDKRLSDDGCQQYRIRWEGYTQQDDTWQPIQMLENCLEMLKEFQKDKEAQNKKDKRKKATLVSKKSMMNLMNLDLKGKSPDEEMKKKLVLRTHQQPVQSIKSTQNKKNSTLKQQESAKNQRSICKNYYNVSKIVDKRVNQKNKIEYKVRWAGFSQQDDTWQPVQNLKYVCKLFERFDQKFNKTKSIIKTEKFLKFTVKIRKNEKIQNNLYQIEKIVDKRLLNDGTIQYRVRWRDYSQDQDTWQPLKNLRRVANLVENFNKKYLQEHNQSSKQTKLQETLQKQHETWKQSHIIIQEKGQIFEQIQQYQQQYSQSVKQISIFNDPIIQMQVENALFFY